jgi:hypothetical protein
MEVGKSRLMGMLSIWHWIIVLFVFIVPNIPAYWVFRKAGWNGWLFLLFGLPLVNLILLYVFAFARWPNEALKADAQR